MQTISQSPNAKAFQCPWRRFGCHLNDKAKKFVEPLADEVEAEMFLPLVMASTVSSYFEQS